MDKSQSDIMEQLLATTLNPSLPERLRGIAGCLFETLKNEKLSTDQMLSYVAFISGFACGVMTDAADELEKHKAEDCAHDPQ